MYSVVMAKVKEEDVFVCFGKIFLFPRFRCGRGDEKREIVNLRWRWEQLSCLAF